MIARISSLLEWRRLIPLLEAGGVETWAVDILGWGFSNTGEISHSRCGWGPFLGVFFFSLSHSIRSAYAVGMLVQKEFRLLEWLPNESISMRHVSCCSVWWYEQSRRPWNRSFTEWFRFDRIFLVGNFWWKGMWWSEIIFRIDNFGFDLFRSSAYIWTTSFFRCSFGKRMWRSPLCWLEQALEAP